VAELVGVVADEAGGQIWRFLLAAQAHRVPLGGGLVLD
jgi:hypothetical protein